MNELPRRPNDSPDKPLAKVYKVDFGKNDDSDEYFDPEEINDSEVVGRFLSQLSHPGYQRQGHNLGEYIQGILGDRNDEDVQSRASKSWSDRIKTVMIDIDLLPRNEIEAL